MNAAARLVTDTGKYEHITPVLRDTLHWLPVQQRTIFKIAVLAFHCVRAPVLSTSKMYACRWQPYLHAPTCELLIEVTWCHLQKRRLVAEVSALQHPLFGIYYHFIFTMQLLVNDNLNQR